MFQPVKKWNVSRQSLKNGCYLFIILENIEKVFFDLACFCMSNFVDKWTCQILCNLGNTV